MPLCPQPVCSQRCGQLPPAGCRQFLPFLLGQIKARMQSELSSCFRKCSEEPAQDRGSQKAAASSWAAAGIASAGPAVRTDPAGITDRSLLLRSGSAVPALSLPERRWQVRRRLAIFCKCPISWATGLGTQRPVLLPNRGRSVVAQGWACGSDQPGLVFMFCCFLAASF